MLQWITVGLPEFVMTMMSTISNTALNHIVAVYSNTAIAGMGDVVSGECIQCMQCLSICPKESLSANPAGAIAGTAAAVAIGGTVEDGYIADIAVLSFQDSREHIGEKRVVTMNNNAGEKKGEAR